MVIARRLEKTILRAPADGVVSVIFAEVGEAVRAGQPVLAIEECASSGCRSTRGKICCTASRRCDRLRALHDGLAASLRI